MISFFESRARQSALRRIIERDSFSEQELEPIEIVEISHTRFGNLNLAAIKKVLDRHGVFFIMKQNHEALAMVAPVSFEYLLQVRDVLKDERRFTVTPNPFRA